jgi:predicted negative regulator of RcsB-dependent stress response
MATDMKNLAHAQGDTPEELENLKAWWNEHGNLVTIVLLVVLAAVVGFKQLSAWRERSQANAMAELRQAADPEALEALVRSAPASVVPLARLQLGAYYYGRHNYDLALDAYRGIVEDSPDHALAGPLAAVGVAQCEEALGHVEKAAELFAAFAAANTNSYLAPLATIGRARCLVLQGTEESRAKGKQILDLFLTESPDTAWAAQADEVIRARNRLSVPAAPAAVDVETLLAGPGEAAPDAAAAAVADALSDPEAPEPEAPAEKAEPEAAPAPEAPAPETPAAEPAPEAPAEEPAA